MDRWKDKEFIKELERRSKSFLDGTAKTYTWEEDQANAKQALANRNKSNKFGLILKKKRAK